MSEEIVAPEPADADLPGSLIFERSALTSSPELSRSTAVFVVPELSVAIRADAPDAASPEAEGMAFAEPAPTAGGTADVFFRRSPNRRRGVPGRGPGDADPAAPKPVPDADPEADDGVDEGEDPDPDGGVGEDAVPDPDGGVDEGEDPDPDGGVGEDAVPEADGSVEEVAVPGADGGVEAGAVPGADGSVEEGADPEVPAGAGEEPEVGSEADAIGFGCSVMTLPGGGASVARPLPQ
ncbi:hypothetical protein [Actinoplanes philippinensis]|uniref:hypothetical protein n=1 Tax=Actinoplanes philippinensis TaxID=35752 RepID=UPI0015A61FE6|nr:hypothetical protein [Actinoplanes philippinensis]